MTVERVPGLKDEEFEFDTDDSLATADELQEEGIEPVPEELRGAEEE